MHIAIVPLIGLLLIIAIAYWAISQITLPPPIRMIIIVVVAVLCILWVGQTFGVFSGGQITVGSA